MFDVPAAFRTLLLTQSGVTTQVSTRIYCAPGLAREQQALMPRKCLVLLSMPGSEAHPQIPAGIEIVQARCYGATAVEARAVYNALFDAAQRLRKQRPATGQYIGNIVQSGGPFDLVEPEVEWPVVISTWMLYYATATVTVA